MNNVDISHIIFVQKDSRRATLRNASDRNALEKIRRTIGSSFNLHASQFQDVDCLLFTEHELDYDIIMKLASHRKIIKHAQNVKLSGFSRWKDYIHYREAYLTYFGKHIECSMLLDRDYYPEDYLQSISNTLLASAVKITFTPGKEIENLFLEEYFLAELLPKRPNEQDLHDFLDQIYRREHDTCKLKYAEFAKDYSETNKRKTVSTVYSETSPSFDLIWNDKAKRHNLIGGKSTLAEVREFFTVHYRIKLTTSLLARELSSRRRPFVEEFLNKIL